jgi:hypothetical protein
MAIENIINSLGVSLVLLGFLLLTLKKLRPEDKAYNLLNLAGAALTGYGSYLIHAIPFVVLEFVWGAVAMFALVRNAPRKQKIEMKKEK